MQQADKEAINQIIKEALLECSRSWNEASNFRAFESSAKPLQPALGAFLAFGSTCGFWVQCLVRDEAIARAWCRNISGQEFSKSEDLADGVAEVLNMIGGYARPSLEKVLGSLSLGVVERSFDAKRVQSARGGLECSGNFGAFDIVYGFDKQTSVI